MRRFTLSAASAIAFVAALAVGPFGAAAAAPYVYGCTPADLFVGATYTAIYNVYNGSATTTNLTTKFLAGNGTILNPAPKFPVQITTSLPATKTLMTTYGASGSGGSIGNGTVLASVRIVSNVPVAASLTHVPSGLGIVVVTCTPLQP